MTKKELHKKIFLSLTAIAFIISAQCSSTQNAKTSGNTPEKNSRLSDKQKSPEEIIRNYMDRESDGLSLRRVSDFSDLQILATDEIKAQAVDEKTTLFSIPIGAESPIECTVFYGNQSPANVMRKLFEKVRSNSDLELIGLKEISTGVSSRIPFLYSEIEYLTKEKFYGTVKTASYASLGFVLMCYHDELGFRKTFRASVDSFAASEKIQNNLKKIQKFTKRDIQEIRFNEQTIGYSENFLFAGENEVLNYYTVSNYLLFHNKNMIAGELVDDIYFNKNDGSIASGKYLSYKNDASEYEIAMEETTPGIYRVDGTFRGDKILKEFRPDSRILLLDFVLDKIVSGKGDPQKKIFKIYQYHASYPDQLPLSELTVHSLSNQEGKFSLISGPLKMELLADQNGISQVSVLNERTTMITKRIFSE